MHKHSNNNTRRTHCVALRHIVIAFLTVMLSASCTDSYNRCADRAMARAEAQMDTAPDSALLALDSIDSSRLHGERRRALHALLLTQARDKNYIDQTSDSLLLPAVEYFDSHTSAKNAYYHFLSHYYLSRIRFYNKDIAEASQELENARNIIQQSDIPNQMFWLARVHNDLAKYAYQTSDYKNSIEHRDRAIELFDSLHYDGWKTDAYLDKIQTYQVCDKWKYTQTMIDTIAPQCATTYQQEQITLIQIKEASHYSQWETAISLYNQLFYATPSYSPDTYDYAYMSYLYARNKDLRASNDYMNKASETATTPNDSFTVSHYRLVNSMIELQNDSLTKLFEEYRHKSFSETQSRVKNQISVGAKNFHMQQQKIETLKVQLMQSRLTISIVCLIVLILIFTISFVIYRQKKNNKLQQLIIMNKTIQQNMTRLQTLITDNENKNNANITVISDIFTNCIVQINHISKKKINAEKDIDIRVEHNKLKKELYNVEKSFIREFANTVSLLNSLHAYNMLESAINYTENNLMTSFRKDFPHLAEKDVQLAIQIFSKMSSHTICIILGLPNLETFRNRKSRLKRTIEKTDSALRDTYLQKFNIKDD